MSLEHKLEVPCLTSFDLVERVRLIVEAWGREDGLDGSRVVEIAWNLYGANNDEVREALIQNLREGKIKGTFSAMKSD
jgi:hypothetical protein